MKNLVLKPWPFPENEPVTLYWIESPWKGRDSSLLLSAIFKKEDGTFSKIVFPWGTLPFLSLGAEYRDGQFFDRPADPGLSSFSFKANEIISEECTMAYRCIDKEHYPLKECSKFAGYEQCIRLSLKSGRKMIFPCLMVIQKVLCPSVFLTNQILTSSGYAELTSFYEIDAGVENILNIEFTSDYDLSILNTKMVSQFSWFLCSERAQDAWRQVYASFVAEDKLQTFFPFREDERIWCTGILYGDTMLVLDFSISMIHLPFQEIVYSHPARTISDQSLDTKKRKLIPVYPDDDDTIPLDDRESSSQRSGGVNVTSMIANALAFDCNPKIALIKEKAPGGTTKKIFYNASDKSKFTTHPNLPGSTGRPVEVDATDESSDEPDIENKIGAPFGLEAFYRALRFIKRDPRVIETIEYLVTFIGNTAFERTPDNDPRTCVVSKIFLTDHSERYVIEASYAFDWSISTMIIRGVKEVSENDFINGILSHLVASGGHWRSDWQTDFPGLIFRTLKHHAKRPASRWAALIMAWEE